MDFSIVSEMEHWGEVEWRRVDLNPDASVGTPTE